MKKMQEAELRVVKFELSDVIVASGQCPPVVADVYDCAKDIQDQCTINTGCGSDLIPTCLGDGVVSDTPACWGVS